MIPDADIDYQYLSDFKLIGKGIFGVVYKASYLGTDVAVKECHPIIKQYGFDFEKVFNREVTILKECRHPNIVQYMGTCIHENKFYIVTEYVKNDNLKTWITERIEEMPWKLRVNFAIDIARALAYLHSKNIMHRDIKPENILITENGRAKICDFGFSRFAAKTEEEKRRLSFCGTETYMAPEIILCMDFNKSIDIFGYGIILCEMIAGQLAEKAYKRKIPGFEIDPDDVHRYAEKDPLCPEEFVKLAISCTKYEEDERPSWKSIITKLNEIDETIENSYNIGIIPAAGLISNDFLIPLSPAIKGQTIDYSGGTTTIKKTNSVKSLNIDTEELKKSNKKHYNGRPTSPELNTRRMSNQYYYYFAVNNPSNDQQKNIYRRLPVYITPPLEHSSIIAVPKDIPKLSINSPEIPKLTLNSPAISDFELLSSSFNSNSDSVNSNSLNRNSKPIIITKEEYQKTSSSSPSLSPTNKHNLSKEYPTPLPSGSSSPLVNNKNDMNNTILDISSLTLNNNNNNSILGSSNLNNSFTLNSPNENENTLITTSTPPMTATTTTTTTTKTSSKNTNDSSDVDANAKANTSNLSSSSSSSNSIPTSPQTSYNYLKNYAILNHVDDIMKKQTYNNIVLDKEKSRSTVDMKARTGRLESSSKFNSSNNLSLSHSPQRHQRHTRHHFYHRHHHDTDEEDEIQSTVSTSVGYESNPPSSKLAKSNKRISLPPLYDIRAYPNTVQKRRESLLSQSPKSPLPFDNDETLTMPDNNNKSYVMPTIEDIYNSEKENITGIHHRFSINNIPCLYKCNVCKRRMSLVKRYLVCDDCNFRCHAKCSSLAPFSCTCTNRKK